MEYFLHRAGRHGGERADRLLAAAMIALNETSDWAAARVRLHEWITAVGSGRVALLENFSDLNLLPEKHREAARALAISCASLFRARGGRPGRRHRAMTSRQKFLKSLAKRELGFVVVVMAEAQDSKLKMPTPSELMYLAVALELERPLKEVASADGIYKERLNTWKDRLRQAEAHSRAISRALRLSRA